MKHEELTKLRREYNRLPDEEKIERLETIAQYYLGQLAREADIVVDLTKYWPHFKLMKEDGYVSR